MCELSRASTGVQKHSKHDNAAQCLPIDSKFRMVLLILMIAWRGLCGFVDLRKQSTKAAAAQRNHPALVDQTAVPGTALDSIGGRHRAGRTPYTPGALRPPPRAGSVEGMLEVVHGLRPQPVGLRSALSALAHILDDIQPRFMPYAVQPVLQAVIFADAYVKIGERLHKAGYVPTDLPLPAHDRHDTWRGCSEEGIRQGRQWHVGSLLEHGGTSWLEATVRPGRVQGECSRRRIPRGTLREMDTSTPSPPS